MRLLHQRHDHAGRRAAGNPKRPTEEQVRQALAANLCKCGTHVRILRAVMRAAGKDGLSRAMAAFDVNRDARFCSAAARSSSPSRSRPRAEPRGAGRPAASERRSRRRRRLHRDRRAAAWSRSTRGKVELGTGVADGADADRRRRAVGAVRPRDDDPGRHGADARPGSRPTPASDPERRHADPPRRGHGARRTARPSGAASSASRKDRARRPRRRRHAQGRRRPVCPMRELVGDRRLTLKVNPAAPLKDPKDYTIVGNAGAPARHSRQDLRHASRSCRMSGCRACCMRAWCIPRRSVRRCNRLRRQRRAARSRAICARCARATSWPSSRRDEWAAIRASHGDRRDVERLGRPARRGAARRATCATPKIDRDEVLQSTGNADAALKRCRPHAAGDLRLPAEHARLDRAFVRGRRVQGRPADGLDAIAGEPPAARSSSRPCWQLAAGAACAASTSKAPAATAATAPTTARPKRRLIAQGDRPAGAPAMDARRTSTAGTRRARRRCSTTAPRSTTEGRIAAWEADVFMPERPMKRSGVTLLAATLAKLPRYGPVERTASPTRAWAFPTRLANNKLTAHWLVDTPLPAAWIRAPGRMQNTFGNESFLDEIAAAAGVDPFEIRMRYLNDARGLELLERLRSFAKWQPRGSRAARHRADRARARRARTPSTSSCAPMSASSPTSRSIAPPARSRSSASSSCTTAARSSTPTACATRSKATSCRP